MVSLMVIHFSTKCFLCVYMYVDLLKLKAYKVFENSDADLSWFLFKEVNLYRRGLMYVQNRSSFDECILSGTNSLSPARWHDKHTYLSSLGMLGTTQLY